MSPNLTPGNHGIAIHGGAGTVSRTKMTEWKEKAFREALRTALIIGHVALKKGGKALDAVTESVVFMEDCELFNAGKGSVFTHSGDHEMDASIMDGKTLKAGAVSSIKSVKNAVLFARTVMEKSRHVMLSGNEAMAFAKLHNIKLENSAYFYNEFRHKQWQKAKKKDEIALDHDEPQSEPEKFGTVGAVALDKRGNLAAATSTGGMVNKRNGRVGDSPIIGAGTYADNSCGAISCTGHGEYFIRFVAAHEVISIARHTEKSLKEAAESFIMGKLKEVGGRGGMITIDPHGEISTPFNTKGMYRGIKKSDGKEFIGIYL